MTRYAVIVNRPGYLPDYMDDLDDFDDIDDAVAAAVAEIEDSCSIDSMHYRGDWQSALREMGPVYFTDDLDGQVYVIQIHEVTA